MEHLILNSELFSDSLTFGIRLNYLPLLLYMIKLLKILKFYFIVGEIN